MLKQVQHDKFHGGSYFVVLGSFFFLVITIIVTPFIGSQELDYNDVLQFLQGAENPDGLIFFKIRLPRILLAVLAGASLSLAGVIFQALLREISLCQTSGTMGG